MSKRWYAFITILLSLGAVGISYTDWHWLTPLFVGAANAFGFSEGMNAGVRITREAYKL